MATNLSICLCIRDSDLNYLASMFDECFMKFFPQAEFLICCNTNSKPVLNYLTSKKNLKIFQMNVPDDRLDYMYKTGADNASKAYTLFLPHQRFHMFSDFPKALRIQMAQGEEFISVFEGKNFTKNSILLCKTSIFKKNSFSLSSDFLNKFLTFACTKITTHVEWYDYYCEKNGNSHGVEIPGRLDVTLENPTKRSVQEIVDYKLSGVPKVKNVLVVTTDPYPLEDDYCPPAYLKKAKTTTAPGLRSWSMINWLHNQGVQVTLGCISAVFVTPVKPYKFPIINIEKTDVNIYSTCICQTGHSAVDRVVGKYKGNLILDCWVPSIVEYPLSLMRRNLKIPNYTGEWKTVSSKLYQVANYFLYPHERTLGLVIGAAVSSQKITINDMIDTKRFIHVPYCSPVSTSFSYPTKTHETFLISHPTCRQKTTFCWFGGNYPWFDFEKVLTFYKELSTNYKDDIALVLKSFNNFPSLTQGLHDRGISNLIVDNDWLYQEQKINYLTDIDYFFILGGVGFEGIFANRTRTLDLCSLGCHVITNHNDVVGQIAAQYGLATLVRKENVDETLSILTNLIENKEEVKRKKDIRGFREVFSYSKYYPKILEIL